MGFLERCLDAGVLLTPGSASGEAYGNWVRLCFTTVPQDQLDMRARPAAGRDVRVAPTCPATFRGRVQKQYAGFPVNNR